MYIYYQSLFYGCMYVYNMSSATNLHSTEIYIQINFGENVNADTQYNNDKVKGENVNFWKIRKTDSFLGAKNTQKKNMETIIFLKILYLIIIDVNCV